MASTYAAEAGSTSCSLVDAGHYVSETGASQQVACPPGSYSGSGASACTDCEEGRYSSAVAQSSCALSNGGYYVVSSGTTAMTACAAGRYSGAGAAYCSLCPTGTTSDVGEASCTTTDAGYIAPTPEVYEVTIASSVTLDGVDADAFNDDATANDQLSSALAFVLVEDLFTNLVESAQVLSVGPASTVSGSTEIAFALAANYSAAASENITGVKRLIVEDFRSELVSAVNDGTLDYAIYLAVSNGRRLRRSLSGSSALSSATVNADATVSSVETTTAQTEIVSEESIDGQQQCPAGTYSLSGDTACVYCDAGS